MTKTGTILTALALLMIAAPGYGQNGTTKQSPLPSNLSPMGVWRAQGNGLPFVTLVLTDEGGSIAGGVLFYFHLRNPGQPETATPGLPEPMLNIKVEGDILTFQVSHRRAHPPRTLSDPPVNFRLKVGGAEKGELINESEGPLSIEMVRTDY
jgi:hypothetical protein